MCACVRACVRVCVCVCACVNVCGGHNIMCIQCVKLLLCYRFKWNVAKLKPDFSITPVDGYISPGMEVFRNLFCIWYLPLFTADTV